MPRRFYSTRASTPELPVTPKASTLLEPVHTIDNTSNTKTCFKLPKVFGNDANGVVSLFSRHGVTFKSDVLLTDDTLIKPTKANILRALNELVDNVRPGMNILFTYAGHGAYVKNSLDPYETDHRDETLVPLDCDSAGMIKDDEVNRILCRLPEGSNMFIITDCCHSGTVTDLPYLLTLDPVSTAPPTMNPIQPIIKPVQQGYPAPLQSVPVQLSPVQLSKPLPNFSKPVPSQKPALPYGSLALSPYKMHGEPSIHFHHSSKAPKKTPRTFRNLDGDRIRTSDVVTVAAPGIVNNIDVVYKESILARSDLEFYNSVTDTFASLVDVGTFVYNTLQRLAVDRTEFDSVLVSKGIYYCTSSSRYGKRFYVPDQSSKLGYSEDTSMTDRYVTRIHVDRIARYTPMASSSARSVYVGPVQETSGIWPGSNASNNNIRIYADRHFLDNLHLYTGNYSDRQNSRTDCMPMKECGGFCGTRAYRENNTSYFNNTTLPIRVNLRVVNVRPPNCRANIFAISGCDDDQTSKEDSNSNGSCGAMSNAFSQVLDRYAGRTVNIQTFAVEIRNQLVKFDQVPQICSSQPVTSDMVLDLTELV